MFEQFKSILVDDMSIDPNLVTMDAELTADLGINSLELADLILLCEDKLGVEIDDKQLSKFISVGDVVNYLQSLE
ncbi:MAG: acyl carrier protein [Eubacteriales bacterium]|nr:acyl carrier protein [Clostridiales bacterium]MDD7300357.1 acyl carrier protein [Eubacteriales bacterium]MDY4434827.1 acyl carrier protein [Candidatus Flemingibacterium sp.]